MVVSSPRWGDTIEEREGQVILNGQALVRELLDEPCSLPEDESCTASGGTSFIKTTARFLEASGVLGPDCNSPVV